MFLEKNKKFNYSSGFTLIEIILVMFLVSFVFTGIYSLLAKISHHEKDNRYVIIASNLAQEGVEIIRNRRDENLLEELDMNDGLSVGVCQPYWDGSDGTGTAHCNGSKSVNVGLDANGIYGNGEASSTIFKRSCDISASGGLPVEELLEIECTVSWKSPSLKVDKEVSVTGILTDWQKN